MTHLNDENGHCEICPRMGENAHAIACDVLLTKLESDDK